MVNKFTDNHDSRKISETGTGESTSSIINYNRIVCKISNFGMFPVRCCQCRSRRKGCSMGLATRHILAAEQPPQFICLSDPTRDVFRLHHIAGLGVGASTIHSNIRLYSNIRQEISIRYSCLALIRIRMNTKLKC